MFEKPIKLIIFSYLSKNIWNAKKKLIVALETKKNRCENCSLLGLYCVVATTDELLSNDVNPDY